MVQTSPDHRNDAHSIRLLALERLWPPALNRWVDQVLDSRLVPVLAASRCKHQHDSHRYRDPAPRVRPQKSN